MNALFSLFVLHLPHFPVPCMLQHLVPATAFLRLLLRPHAVLTHLSSVGIIGVLAPLTDALKGPGKSLSWSPALNSTFTRAKHLLSSYPELVLPQPDAPISLSVDASDTHLGAVLQQLLDGSWAPLAFYSKKLSYAEKKYSTFDGKLLAAYSSLRHFRFMRA